MVNIQGVSCMSDTERWVDYMARKTPTNIAARVTAAESRLLKVAAESAGMTRSAYIRAAVVAAMRKTLADTLRIPKD